jgi:putative oxidoreductase
MRDRYPGLYRVEDGVAGFATLDLAALLGRVLLVVVFLVYGFNNLMALGPATTFASSKLPMADILVPVAAVLQLVAGLMIVIGFQVRIASVALIIFVLVATFAFHDFWNMTGPARSANATNFYKNLGLIGGLLVLIGTGPGRYSVDRR